MTSSKLEVNVSESSSGERLLEVSSKPPCLDFSILVTSVSSKMLAFADATMFAKICQLPPSTDMAPVAAMHTMVSRPWKLSRFCA